MQKNPWQTLSTSFKYGNKWFSVYEHQVIQPDGSPGIYNTVSAARLATGILPLWPDGSLTLVGQYRYPLDQYSWEIPEGGGSFDDDPLEIAKQELSEETGLEAENWEHLGHMHTSNCFMDEVCHLFLAEDLKQGVAHPDPQEIIQICRLPFIDVIKMASEGQITDSISIAGIFRLMWRRNFVSQ